MHWACLISWLGQYLTRASCNECLPCSSPWLGAVVTRRHGSHALQPHRHTEWLVKETAGVMPATSWYSHTEQHVSGQPGVSFLKHPSQTRHSLLVLALLLSCHQTAIHNSSSNTPLSAARSSCCCCLLRLP